MDALGAQQRISINHLHLSGLIQATDSTALCLC
jgi:hypothetical protein